ncbi:hypothetical protein TanjilG_11405 [Lupinus angustifolius]|uniref:MADS-box domain-containing protein n=1 Tax=Lupinus angustifolius TaxID=3871 RepID=A0A1J7HN35_LUPAN|nr:PREDICTED: agamous-like MADS-box protein AGL80 [Lupinus angustifolius]OIW14060.1 hypothetical protein TanjilG_11405 [Lupinus angustifolius]
MARRNTKLAYIANDAKRNATYKKRKNSLIKKTKEISTLCGVETCAIIYSSNGLQPEVWPSHFEVQKVLYKFLTMPPLEQSRKMFDQEMFLKQRIMKAQEQLKKKKIQNRKEMMSLLMIKCLSTGKVEENVNAQNANDLLWVIDENLKELDEKITRNQPQEGTPTNVNVQGMIQTNVNNGRNEMVPFENFNISNGFWHGPSIH